MFWWAAFQSWDLFLIIKTTDWSQAEQGEAEALYLLGTNLHQPALTQCKGQVGSCFQDSEVQIPQTPGVHDQTWLYPCREGRGMDTSQLHQNPGKKGSFPSAISEPLGAATVSSAGMMGLMLQGIQEMGKDKGMNLFCLPCTAILGSSQGANPITLTHVAHTILSSPSSKHPPGSVRAKIWLKPVPKSSTPPLKISPKSEIFPMQNPVSRDLGMVQLTQLSHPNTSLTCRLVQPGFLAVAGGRN